MNRTQIMFLGLGGIASAAAVAESFLGRTAYQLNGATYDVPHRYEFMRNFSLPWLQGIRGLDKEPDESLWLLLPAKELKEGITGYHQMFRGYSGEVEADAVVNILGGQEARKFLDHRKRLLGIIADEERRGAVRQPDSTTGWTRIVWLGGEKGTPAEGHSNFYLIPPKGRSLPTHWLPPSCQGSPDIEGQERFTCSFTVHRSGLTYEFDLRQENLGVAEHVPDYVFSRLKKWRR